MLGYYSGFMRGLLMLIPGPTQTLYPSNQTQNGLVPSLGPLGPFLVTLVSHLEPPSVNFSPTIIINQSRKGTYMKRDQRTHKVFFLDTLHSNIFFLNLYCLVSCKFQIQLPTMIEEYREYK